MKAFFTAALLLVSSALPLQAAAQAAPKQAQIPLGDALSGEAKAEYDAARILFGDDDFAGALVKFERAFEFSGDLRLLWNMAVCEKSLPFEATASFLLMADKPGIPHPIKLQEQHKPLFPLDQPITELSGQRIAEWASGGASDEPDWNLAHREAIKQAPTVEVLQVAFDARLQRDFAGWASHACPVQSDLNHALRGDMNQFHIPAVRLNGRPDQIQHARHLIVQ